jgi:DNA-binding IclR family transcriptional regulator
LALVRAIHETGNIAILSGDMVLYTDKATSDQPFGIEARVGSKLPAYCTALGKVLVANLDPDDFTRYLEHMRATRRHTTLPKPPAESSLKAELGLTAQRGYAIDRGEYLPDVYCAAAPIIDAAGVVVAAMSVSVPRSRFDANKDGIVAAVREHAAALSESLSEVGLPHSPVDFAPSEFR